MNIEKVSNRTASAILGSLQKLIPTGKEQKKISDLFRNIQSLFGGQVSQRVYMIKCLGYEVDSFLSDIIHMLAQHNYLAVYILVGECVEVETINRLEAIKKDCAHFTVFPTGINSRNIVLFIATILPEYCEAYDIEAAVDMLNYRF